MSKLAALPQLVGALFLITSLGCSATSTFPTLKSAGESLNASPSTLSFVTTGPNATSQQKVSLQNSGGIPVTVQSISISGSPVFSVAKRVPPVSLQPGEMMEVAIGFTSSTVGTFDGALNVAASSAHAFAVPLKGTVGSPIDVNVSPVQAVLQVGTHQRFTATISGSADKDVTWYVNGAKNGTASYGTIDTAGTYTAPRSLPARSQVLVSAVSAADTSKSASSSVTLVGSPKSVSITISPQSASIQGGTAHQFTAMVSGTSNSAVNWLVNGTNGGDSTYGTISPGGQYTAPACPLHSTVTVTAQSSYDPAASASATVSLTAGSLNATDRYVASNGSDKNDGSACHAWATVQHAASLARPGWTIHVGPGTYSVGAGIVNNNSGTQSARIVYVGDYDKSTWTWNTKLVSTGTAVWTTSADYVDIVGFDLTSTDSSATWGFHTGGSYIRIMDNYVHDIYSNSPGAGIMIGGSNAVGDEVNGNVVAQVANTFGGSTDNQCIYTTQSYTTIVNNVVFGCHKYGIQIYSHIPNGSTHNVIANNTVFASYRGIVVGGENTGSGAPSVDYNTVTNNIVYDNKDFGLNVVGIFGSHNVTSNNLVDKNGTNYSGTYKSHTGDISKDPLFVNYKSDGTGDYQLQPASPCRDAGTSTAAPKYDFLHATRPQGSAVDCGAYEYVP